VTFCDFLLAIGTYRDRRTNPAFLTHACARCLCDEGECCVMQEAIVGRDVVGTAQLTSDAKRGMTMKTERGDASYCARILQGMAPEVHLPLHDTPFPLLPDGQA
jgi:hypothetical protein